MLTIDEILTISDAHDVPDVIITDAPEGGYIIRHGDLTTYVETDEGLYAYCRCVCVLKGREPK